MTKLFKWSALLLDRRTVVALIAIACLTVLGLWMHDAVAVANSIAIVAVGIAGANAFERRSYGSDSAQTLERSSDLSAGGDGSRGSRVLAKANDDYCGEGPSGNSNKDR